jgi:hypothetical protein
MRQEPPRGGKVTGRYVDQPDKGDVVDQVTPAPGMTMRLFFTVCSSLGNMASGFPDHDPGPGH